MLKTKPLKVAMVGTGNICLQHAQAIRYAKYPSEIVALYNHNPEKLEAFSGAFALQCSLGLGTAPCRLYTNLEQMLDEAQPDVVYVTTPHPTHVSMALPVVERGIPCMLEKPLDSSIQQAKKLKEAAVKSKALVSVIAQSRFFPAVERIKEYLVQNPQDQAVTGIVNVMAWRDENYYKSNVWRGSWASEGGGVLVNQSVHELDLLCYFLGAVRNVFGIWRNINHPYIEVDDTAQALVTFESGAVANILVSNSVDPAYRNYVRVVTHSGKTLSITTHEGVEENAGLAPYEFSPYNDVFTVASEQSVRSWQEQESLAQSSAATNGSPFPFFTLQYENFAQAVIEQNTELLRSDLDSALGCMQIFQGIYLSQKLGRPVSVDEIMSKAH